MTVPQDNAELRGVAGASSGETYDGPGAAGAGKWAPGADAVRVYLRETRNRQETQGGQARTIDRVLIVENAVDVDWRSGDVVTFRRDGAGADEIATIRLVERRQVSDPDIDPDLQTTRLTLETA